MPMKSYQISEIDYHIKDKLTTYFTRTILTDLGVMHFFNDANLSIRTGSRALSRTTDNNGNISLPNTRCIVTASSTINPSSLPWSPTLLTYARNGLDSELWRNNTKFPILYDPECDVQLEELTAPMGINMEFELKFDQKEAARQAEISLISKYKANIPYINQDAMFDYPLSMSVLADLFSIYKMANVGDMDFLSWIKSKSFKDIKFITDISNRKELVLEKKVAGILGELTYDTENIQPDKINQYPNRWVVNFTYRTQFSCPIGLRLHYPCFINNTLIPVNLIPNRDPSYTFKGLRGMLPEQCLHTYELENLKETVSQPIRVPVFNNFILPKCALKDRRFRPFFIGASSVDDPNGYSIIDLKDLSNYAIHPIALTIMSMHDRDIFQLNGIFNITVFENNYVVAPDDLMLDSNFILHMKLRHPKNRYQIVISEATDITYMDGKYIAILLKYRYFFPGIISKHIDKLVKYNYYQIDPKNRVLWTITRCIESGNMNKYLDSMIAAGHCTVEIYQYTVTSWQLLEYLKSVRSPVNGYYLYTILRDIGISSKCIKESDVPPLDPSANNLPILDYGYAGGINLPLRVIDATILPERMEG